MEVKWVGECLLMMDDIVTWEILGLVSVKWCTYRECNYQPLVFPVCEYICCSLLHVHVASICTLCDVTISHTHMASLWNCICMLHVAIFVSMTISMLLLAASLVSCRIYQIMSVIAHQCRQTSQVKIERTKKGFMCVQSAVCLCMCILCVCVYVCS